MTPNEYQKLAKRTECDQWAARLRYLQPSPTVSLVDPIRHNHALIGMMGEIGELASAFEKCFHYGRGLDLKNVKEELGDLLWYVALLCNTYGISLEEVMEANIRKLQVRYPDKYSDHHAAEENRDRQKEAEALVVGEPSLPIGPDQADAESAGPFDSRD